MLRKFLAILNLNVNLYSLFYTMIVYIGEEKELEITLKELLTNVAKPQVSQAHYEDTMRALNNIILLI